MKLLGGGSAWISTLQIRGILHVSDTGEEIWDYIGAVHYLQHMNTPSASDRKKVQSTHETNEVI
jgi:hypothetical protein